MNKHESINYIELPAKNLKKAEAFYKAVFNFMFQYYGEDYLAFNNAGFEGGFYKANLNTSTANGSALVVFYSQKLEETQEKIVNAKGKISKKIFSFPGGRRFHFTDPNGNELAVWSDS